MLVFSLIVIYIVSSIICYLCYSISHNLLVHMFKLKKDLDWYWYRKELYKCFIPLFNSLFIFYLLIRINKSLKINR